MHMGKSHCFVGGYNLLGMPQCEVWEIIKGGYAHEKTNGSQKKNETEKGLLLHADPGISAARSGVRK